MLLLVKATISVISGHCWKINVVNEDLILLAFQKCSPWQVRIFILFYSFFFFNPLSHWTQHLCLLYGLKFLQPKTNNNNACMAGIHGVMDKGRHVYDKKENIHSDKF